MSSTQLRIAPEKIRGKKAKDEATADGEARKAKKPSAAKANEAAAEEAR